MRGDWFDNENVSPMLIADKNQPPFDSPDYVFELKWDGIRGLTYLDTDSTELRNKRNKRLNDIYPELSSIHKQVGRRCILDGEIISIKNGKPDFYEVQRRSLMSNPFRIELAAKKQPVSFMAYDIVYICDEAVAVRPLSWRVEALTELITESASLTISRRIEHDGVALFEAAKAQELEGIVAKRKDSLYFPGKRTKDWVKIKSLIDEDFIVCGYRQEGIVASVIIGAFVDNKIIYQGHVALGVSQHDFKLMEQCERAGASTYNVHYRSFPSFEDATWLIPRLVCTVKYMERTHNGGLRQPVFKGIRYDKSTEECVLS